MKNRITKYIGALGLSIGLFIGFSSCSDYLDVDKYFNDVLSIDTVFARKHYTEQWLWNTYSHLNGVGAEITNKGDDGKGYFCSAFNFASDDVIFGDWSYLCEKYQNCQYTASDQLKENRWRHLYEGINKASVFITNVNKCREMSSNEREDYRAQARFLRAYYYWMLIKQYGPVIILPEEGMNISLDYSSLSLPRSSYDECVDYICAELEQSARVLPLVRSSAWTGQATKGAALATRAKVLIYAASPLYNGNKDLFNLKNKEGKALISQDYSEEKWAKAAAAAKEVIDLDKYELFTIPKSDETTPLPTNVPSANYPDGAGNIDPFESYRQCFNGEVVASLNSELIFTRQNYAYYDINDITLHNVPVTLNGWNTNSVTQKQVDAYYMADGKDINSASAEYPYVTTGFTSSPTDYPHLGANVSLIYANREPRFYASIAFNGSIWENASTTDASKRGRQIFYYYKNNDGKNLIRPENYLRTGTGVKKYYNPNDSWDTGGVRRTKVEPTIRYADVLLWYAEALNELTKSHEVPSYTLQGNITVSRNTPEMQKAFSRVRFRAGLPDLSTKEYNDVEGFRRSLKRERQIEFFYESTRYFDLRRWKDAKEEEAKPILGLDIDMADTPMQRQLFYRVKAAPMRKVFLDKMYLWPIPQEEITKNAKMVQNPGW